MSLSGDKEVAQFKKSVKMGADDNPEETKMDHLPDEVLKNIAKKKGKKQDDSKNKKPTKEQIEALVKKALQEALQKRKG